LHHHVVGAATEPLQGAVRGPQFHLVGKIQAGAAQVAPEPQRRHRRLQRDGVAEILGGLDRRPDVPYLPGRPAADPVRRQQRRRLPPTELGTHRLRGQGRAHQLLRRHLVDVPQLRQLAGWLRPPLGVPDHPGQCRDGELR
jgi:hypothetical protein